MTEEDGEVLFEAWLYKYNGTENGKTLRLTGRWHRRYYVLRRYGETAYLQYYRSKPRHNEVPRDSIALQPRYKVEKLYDVQGKPYVCTVSTPNRKMTMASQDEKIFHLLVFFLQTQVKLMEQVQNECYVIRPDSSEDQRKIGARGNMCVLHVSPCGLILALELSKCVLAIWPLKSVKSYESSQRGQITIEAGKSSPMGEGTYTFKTRMGQDNLIYNAIDSFVNYAFEQRRSSAVGPTEYEELQHFTHVCADARFSNQLRRISRDIYDHLWQHLGGAQGSSVKSSNPDLLNDTTLTKQKRDRSCSVPTILESPATPPPFDHQGWSQHAHRTPPPTNHNYHNDQVLHNVSSPQDIVPNLRRRDADTEYLDMSIPSSAEASPTKSPPGSLCYEPLGEDYAKVHRPRQPSDAGHSAPRMDYINIDDKVSDRGISPESQNPRRRLDISGEFHGDAAVGMSPQRGPRQRTRTLSRSCEDINEHIKNTMQADGFVYNNGMFDMKDEVFNRSAPEADVYSYAEVPGARWVESGSLQRVPKQFIAMRRRQKGADMNNDLMNRDYRSMIRKSLSNPNLADLRHLQNYADGEGGNSLRKSQPKLPLNFTLTRPVSKENMNTDTMRSTRSEAGHHRSPRHETYDPRAEQRRLSDMDSRTSAVSTASSTVALLPDTPAQPPMLKPLKNAEVASGIRVTGRTRTFKKQKPQTDDNQNVSLNSSDV